jgi:hypothetical protein
MCFNKAQVYALHKSNSVYRVQITYPEVGSALFQNEYIDIQEQVGEGNISRLYRVLQWTFHGPLSLLPVTV